MGGQGCPQTCTLRDRGVGLQAPHLVLPSDRPLFTCLRTGLPLSFVHPNKGFCCENQFENPCPGRALSAPLAQKSHGPAPGTLGRFHPGKGTWPSDHLEKLWGGRRPAGAGFLTAGSAPSADQPHTSPEHPLCAGPVSCAPAPTLGLLRAISRLLVHRLLPAFGTAREDNLRITEEKTEAQILFREKNEPDVV